MNAKLISKLATAFVGGLATGIVATKVAKIVESKHPKKAEDNADTSDECCFDDDMYEEIIESSNQDFQAEETIDNQSEEKDAVENNKESEDK